MTRKDYLLIADVISATREETDGTVNGILDNLSNKFARVLLAASKYDLNGNKSFKPDVFLKACGVEGMTDDLKLIRQARENGYEFPSVPCSECGNPTYFVPGDMPQDSGHFVYHAECGA